jgi:hypothetical protein
MENLLVTGAIEDRRLLEFYYDGGIRIVEPHCHGLSRKGNPSVRAYQVDGYSSTGEMGWKLFNLSKASSLRVLDETFTEIRPGYAPGDRDLSTIYSEL